MTASANPALTVTRGAVVALRMFDIAYAIDLAEAERLWTRHSTGRAARSRLSGTPPKAVAFGVPPLAVTLEPVSLDLVGARVEASVLARLYDFGAVSIALRVPGNTLPFADYTRLLNAITQAVGPGASPMLWERLLNHLRDVIAGALIRPTSTTVEEDYLLGIVHRFDPPPAPADLLAGGELLPLLSGETRPLSESARADLLRSRFSYYDDDLVVLTWDRAFIYEPREDSDVADVVEVANAQLLEMRYYDELLDSELPRMYDLVERTRKGFSILAARRYAALAGKLYTLVAEVTELTEKVDNALQVTEDVYLARIYAAALELFRVPTVSAAVDRKLAIIRDTYTALYDEASSQRAELLEIAIVVLIVIEVVYAVFRH